MVELSKARVWGRSLAGIAGSNSYIGMDVCPLWELCAVRERLLRRADHSPRGSYMLLCVVVYEIEPWRMRRLWTATCSCAREQKDEKSVVRKKFPLIMRISILSETDLALRPRYNVLFSGSSESNTFKQIDILLCTVLHTVSRRTSTQLAQQ